jgi:hypothetical protein
VSPGAWPAADASTALAADRTSAGITVSILVTRIIGLRRQRERWCNPAVRVTSDTVAGGIREQLFTVSGIPGVHWTPAGGSGPRPLVLTGHGGGRHKKEPGVLSRAFPYVTAGPRIMAAVPGLGESDVLVSSAPRIAIPVGFVMRWDGAGRPRDCVLTLSGAPGSAGKTLRASPGSHLEVADFEIGGSVRFFARDLGSRGAAI